MNPSSTDLDPDAVRKYTVFVVELDDVVPRRHSDLPNLYVGLTADTVEEKLDRIRRGKRPKWVRGHVVSIRPDLSRWFEASGHETAKRQKTELRKELARRGYTVNKEKTGVWNVYVVQLDESSKPEVGKGWVYVGESSLPPEERLAQHLSGGTNSRGPLYSKVVHRHGQHLRTDLMRGLPTLYSKADSERAEVVLAEQLREDGYIVEGGR